MPIVDGLTSTKMIRSFEKTRKDIYSPRASLNGRIPIIAVSASLLEKARSDYIVAGFDAWILKPISFGRLSELMTAIVDTKVRRECLYRSGEWEKGGWFHMGEKSPGDTDTRPSDEPPVPDPSQQDTDNPTAGNNEPDRIPDEQARLLAEQEKERKQLAEEGALPDDTASAAAGE
jgi:hypothetical protein